MINREIKFIDETCYSVIEVPLYVEIASAFVRNNYAEEVDGPRK